MGRIIAIQAITAAEYLLLAAGFYIQLFGIRECMRRVREGWHRREIIGTAVNLCMIIGSALIGCPVLLTMFFVYLAAVFYLHSGKKDYSSCIFRGLVNLILQLAFQLILCILLYRRWREYLQGSFLENERSTQYIVLVWMLMFQIFLLICGELRNVREKKWRVLYFFVGIVKILEAFWFSQMIPDPNPGMRGLFIILTFLGVILMNYLTIREVEILRKTYSEEKRRVTAPINREEYYTHMEEEHLQIRRMFHDMKNKLMVLEGTRDGQPEYLQEFVRKSKEQLESIDSIFHTGNAELNLLLFEFKKRSRDNGIDFQVIFQEGCLNFMEQEDISTIFVNAILNAIEACLKIRQGERKIQIQVGEHLNDVILSFRNTFCPDAASGGLATTKADKEHHGFGIPSIQRSADRYNGYVSVSEDHQFFQLVILIVKE